MTIIRPDKDDRSEERRLLDEAIRTRVEVHCKLQLPGETADSDPMTHVARCDSCLENLKIHAESCKDGKKLLERCQ